MMNTSSESVAKVLLLNERNEALVLTIGEYMGRPDKSYKPDFPGGMVDKGESELAAVRRELEEETGITLRIEDFSLAYRSTEYFEDQNKTVHKFLFIAGIGYTPEVRLSWEHISYDWVDLDALRSTVELRPFYKEAVEYCFSSGLI